MLKKIDVRGKDTIVNISHPLNPDDEMAYMIVCDSNESVLKISAIRADGECIADVVSATGNTYSYMLPNAVYAVPGVLEIRISQCSSDGSILTTQYLFFNVLCKTDEQAVSEDTSTVMNLLARECAERTAADADKADKVDIATLSDNVDLKLLSQLEQMEKIEQYGISDIQITDSSYFKFSVNTDGKSATIKGDSLKSWTAVSELVIPYKCEINGVYYPVTEIDSHAFERAGITKAILPKSVEAIGYRAFGSCLNLEEVLMPNDVKEIGKAAFINCESLKNIETGDKVTVINVDTFSGCSSLEKVKIGENVTSIGGHAFFECTSLKRISIPESVETIHCGAFYGCTDLERVVFNSDLNQPEIIDSTLQNCPNLTVICPQNSKVEAYCREQGITCRYNWDAGTVVVDDLESTSTSEALSANQGRVLNEKIKSLVTVITDSIFEVNTNTEAGWYYTENGCKLRLSYKTEGYFDFNTGQFVGGETTETHTISPHMYILVEEMTPNGARNLRISIPYGLNPEIRWSDINKIFLLGPDVNGIKDVSVSTVLENVVLTVEQTLFGISHSFDEVREAFEADMLVRCRYSNHLYYAVYADDSRVLFISGDPTDKSVHCDFTVSYAEYDKDIGLIFSISPTDKRFQDTLDEAKEYTDNKIESTLYYNIQSAGERRDYSYAFANTGYTSLNPTYDVICDKCVYMFMNMTLVTDLSNVVIQNESANPNMSYLCMGCINLVNAPAMVFTNSTLAAVRTWTSAFANCVALETAGIYLGTGDQDPVSIRNNMANTFFKCRKLKNLAFTGQGSPINLDLSYAENLSAESLASLDGALMDVSSATSGVYEITINSDQQSKLNTAGLTESITAKGWTLKITDRKEE